MGDMSAEMRAELASLEAKGELDIDTNDAPELPVERMLAGRRRDGSDWGLVAIDRDILADFRNLSGANDPTKEMNRVLRAYVKAAERKPAR
jgi:uncharacterized protein (DUF4415 family)